MEMVESNLLIIVVLLIFPLIEGRSLHHPNTTNIILSLHNAGFNNVDPYLITQLLKFPEKFGIEFTLFVPMDASIIAKLVTTRELIQYHVVPQRMPYQNLTCLPVGYKLPTLLPGRNIIVTSARGETDHQQMLALDEMEVLMPDVYRDDFFVIHAVSGLLNPFIYGAIP